MCSSGTVTPMCIAPAVPAAGSKRTMGSSRFTLVRSSMRWIPASDAWLWAIAGVPTRRSSIAGLGPSLSSSLMYASSCSHPVRSTESSSASSHTPRTGSRRRRLCSEYLESSTQSTISKYSRAQRAPKRCRCAAGSAAPAMMSVVLVHQRRACHAPGRRAW
eukprot:scaffold76062_cov36-Phaeocystis_antarctica.AAC.6